jgi:hypothetical protein
MNCYDICTCCLGLCLVGPVAQVSLHRPMDPQGNAKLIDDKELN